MNQLTVTKQFTVAVLVGLIVAAAIALNEPLWFALGYFGSLFVHMIFDHFKK